jgi:hypothetical protein
MEHWAMLQEVLPKNLLVVLQLAEDLLLKAMWKAIDKYEIERTIEGKLAPHAEKCIT